MFLYLGKPLTLFLYIFDANSVQVLESHTDRNPSIFWIQLYGSIFFLGCNRNTIMMLFLALVTLVKVVFMDGISNGNWSGKIYIIWYILQNSVFHNSLWKNAVLVIVKTFNLWFMILQVFGNVYNTLKIFYVHIERYSALNIQTFSYQLPQNPPNFCKNLY